MYSFIVRPLDKWPGTRLEDSQRRTAPFRTGWRQTCELLSKERKFLQAQNGVILLAVQHGDIKSDGWIRSSARLDFPGAVLVMGTQHGHLRYACDKFRDWQDNIRAIALTLERLRKAEAYGVVQRGEQYAGFVALPAPEQPASAYAVPGFDAMGDAVRFIREHGGHSGGIIASYKEAVKKLHPDSPGGNEHEFKRLQKARATVGI